MTGLSRLTPAFSRPCGGTIHSVFTRTANAMILLPEGERMLTLSRDMTPELPDSAVIPGAALETLRPGTPLSLAPGRLILGGRAIALMPDTLWSGRMPELDPTLRAKELNAFQGGIGTGFDRIPGRRGQMALEALGTPDAPEYIGLGPGLTPSYDDALIGFTALCRAEGAPLPFALKGFDVTTAVSARYLRLASEGFFTGPVIRMAVALAGNGDFSAAVREITAVGATSGADALLGMREALRYITGIRAGEKPRT